MRDIGYTYTIHDIKLLLLRLAQERSFSEESGGGGRQSNVHILPFMMHITLYVINTWVPLSPASVVRSPVCVYCAGHMLPYMVHSMLCVISMWVLFHQFGDEATSSCVGWCPGDVTSFHVLFFFLSFFSPDTVLFQVNVCFSNRSHFLSEGILFPCMLEPGGGGEGQHEHVWMYWCGQMNEFFFGDTGSVMFICNMFACMNVWWTLKIH